MIEELQFEISRLSRRSFLQTNYDASACCDRIIPNMAMLTSRRFGVAKSATETNARTLQQARFHIRTELGLSDTSYSHSSAQPIFGTGQGSGNSPMIWCFISSLLFDCYEKLAHEAKYCNPDRTNELSLSMVGFVDDTNGQVNSFLDDESPSTLQVLPAKATHSATTWTHLLSASGGALELTKCSYHVLHWHFSSNGAPVLVNADPMVERISLVNPVTSQHECLEYLAPGQAHKTLGHFKEPSGIQSTQYRQLLQKGDSITEFLWKTQLTREEAWLYYQACYVPAITYPLTCSFLTVSQLDNIQRRAMSIIVAKCAFNRHTKRAVLYGPIEYGGANFRLLSVSQGIQQTQYFLRHWRMDSTVGRLLKCTLSWLQLSVGMSFSVLARPEIALPHIESKWVTSLRSFLASIHASILLDDPLIPELQREGNQYIMDIIVESKQFTPSQIRILNYCRLYLQAVTISDLTKADGIEADHSKIQGSPSLVSSHTRWHTVHQDRPSTQAWTLWRKANQLWTYPSGQLRQQLGRWLRPIHHQRFQHFAYVHGRKLYIRQADGLYRAHVQMRDTTVTYRQRLTPGNPSMSSLRNFVENTQRIL